MMMVVWFDGSCLSYLQSDDHVDVVCVFLIEFLWLNRGMSSFFFFFIKRTKKEFLNTCF